ncbi:TIM barrel protein [Granulicella tundricola]|uniref:Xylose isomerase domain-containing protein TIM barrel n=1 Tax=Granulicella tundricola (strain ATCC BAA-1859 / DSM 23138 / MP5ACTX9) TaxID=1198114 RepID=E8WZ91_GRATM|nr:TIM barrel protein [Granulicella tundricola]ADW67693.1 Xylose isomerase domain-containing protein TIM barrel [Granulicella tundricola MP5ACTX9]
MPDLNGAVTEQDQQRVWAALDKFRIEIPSWGFANTGTRFGKFSQPAAASTIEEKFADAAQVNALTGVSSTMALHVLWDLPSGKSDIPKIQQLERTYGIRSGSINPNLFQDQEYKYGSICNPSAEIRGNALSHLLDSVEIGRALNSRDVSMWVSDGSNYPGTQSIRRRIEYMEEVLAATHAALGPDQRMLVEYKPFEPAFYHTDIADWGMALELARRAGPKAKVLVDTGHHLQGTNIEQIVAWLLHLNALGGFHFNDRKFADDDLTLGSIDPYQVFRIFHEILSDTTTNFNDIAFMIDQSHNLKGKVEAMVQTVATAQELYAKAALVDHAKLAELQKSCSLVEAEETFREAFWTDVRPIVRAWRQSHNLPANPLTALAESGYVEKISQERSAKNAASVSSYA